jgi:hypothetical protein
MPSNDPLTLVISKADAERLSMEIDRNTRSGMARARDGDPISRRRAITRGQLGAKTATKAKT